VFILLATQSVPGISLGDTIALAGIILAIISTVGGAAWFLSARMSDQHESLQGSIGSVKEDVGNLSTRMGILERDNYTKPEAEAHALRLALNNPYLKVPDPRNPATIIHVAEQSDPPRRPPV
jgi:hypothetical protein